MNPWGGNAAGYGEAQYRVGNVNQGQARPDQARTVNVITAMAQENRVALDAEQLLFLAGGPDNAFDDDVDEQPGQDLALNVDNVFQAEDCDAFDSDDNDFVDDKSKYGYSKKASEAEEIPETIFEAKEPGEIKASVMKEKGDPKYPPGFSPHKSDGLVTKHVSSKQDHGSKTVIKEDLAKKLKIIKDKIRSWVKDKKEKAHVLKNSLKKKLADIDSVLEKGEATSNVLEDRLDAMNSLTKLEKIESIELAQKAKIKWLIEGNENSKYFHGIINKKRNNLAIQGIIVDGIWIEDPSVVKNECLSHFRNRFDSPCTDRLTLDMEFPNVLSYKQAQDSERVFFKMKLNKRPISLIGSIYKIIAKLLANCLVSMFDGLCKAKKKQSMLFKVDFEKAFDSVRWDFLDDILKNFGFGLRRRDWIQSCLKSSRGSILVNGSPTSEFQFSKGLKRGDPLSPLLFILVMESLHLSFQNVVNAGLFKGVALNNSLQIFHLFYTDDVVFIGQWCDSNLSTIKRIFDCFFCASGIRINLKKCGLMGIVVETNKVVATANNLGCRILKSLFSYLGVNIGGHMTQINSWDVVIIKILSVNIGGHMTQINSWDVVIIKILSQLSKWKMKVLSIGGRLTLLKRDPRLGLKLAQMASLQSHLEGTVISNMLDRWIWSLSGDGEFSVSSVRNLIDDKNLGTVGSKTQWLESTDHLFFACPMMKNLYKAITRWWDVKVLKVFTYEEW
nr:RNA-directed DNA polymerase, eukaryota [Tanacetum cinerariifolium]